MTSLISWDVRTERRWVPFFTTTGIRFDEDPIPPVTVLISAKFDNDQAARAFETRVREVLEESS